MRFTPYYTVSYHGRFYPGGVEIEIDEADAGLMEKHGVLTGEKAQKAKEENKEEARTVKRAGRQRKQQ